MIVETKNLNFNYKKSSKGIKNLNLNVPSGSIYGFLGPNGSGKTTTIRILLGLIRPKSGEVSFFDKPFSQNRIQSLKRIGALIEAPSLYAHLNAYDNLKIISRYRNSCIDEKRIGEVLHLVKLEGVKYKKVKAYSMGMKQRLGIAIALLDEPELLILDEPTNGLDPKGIVDMRELIINLNQKKGITVFISSHLLSEIEKTCTDVGIIANGEMVFQNTLQALKRKQYENYTVEIETNHNQKAMLILESIDYKATTTSEELISITLQNKNELKLIIDELRTNEFEIYQIINKSSMESLFLQITDK